ncbi:SAG-related sequence SRS39 [Toxoplasma gondii ME49]|uniref:SAG-related sequence SRS39 n=3 Tax=Toxoplasma gondii TaxID=5811 RepID=A0A2G8XY07_TOXGO|nr:SAG-related sequence SRS39 [Toxoplasma gondii ME49]EPT30357.1 SAG-related sequence SRS39 [Toxoplasma gondii ME49]KYF43972.1 SAG-related sequence SRS39 [Toxoplasma gondii ARI]PIL99910.1 SAG-related sequence SRS39 [Toxoplasma gondii COUG]|eukprot:XP_002371402.1 SAG-related sequence SRS39 [Toxoplasma gondii ME49]
MVHSWARAFMKRGVLAALAAVCIAARVSGTPATSNTCVLAEPGADLSVENHTRVALSVTRAGQQVFFTCPDGSPLDPTRAVQQGRFYAASADGTTCLSSQAPEALSDKVPGSYLTVIKGEGISETTVAFFVPALPATAQNVCFSCSGRAANKQDCPVVISIAGRTVGRAVEEDLTCNGEGEKKIAVTEPGTLTLHCGTETPTADPTLARGNVFTGADCTEKVELNTVLKDATLEVKPQEQTPPAQNPDEKKDYVLKVTSMPEATQQICLKCVQLENEKTTTPQKTCTFKIAVGKDAEVDSAGFRPSVVSGVAVGVFVLASSLIQ